MPDPVENSGDTLLGAASTGQPAADQNVNNQASSETPNPGGDPNASSSDPAAPPGGTPAPAGDPAPAGAPAPAGDPTPAGNDWMDVRTRAAGGDEKVLARLARYGTLDEALRAGVEAQNKLGERVTDKAPGSDASDDEKAAYREANGIPKTAADYEIALPDGLVLGDADKPVADAFLAIAHEHNISPAVANDIIAGQLRLQDEAIQAQETADAEDRTTAQTILTSQDMWGSESTANLNMINALLDNSPPGTKEQIMGARLADGTMLGNNVDALKWLNAIARQVNPTATIVPSQGRTALVSAQEEMKEIEGLMGDKESAYNKGPKAEAMQIRYRELIDYVLKTTPQN